MQTRLGVFCEKVIEAGWLAAAVVVPLHFNAYSQQVFEPDKLAALRFLALFMATAWTVRFLERHGGGRGPEGGWGATAGTAHGRPWWHHPSHAAPALLVLLLVGVNVLSTLFSVVPRISLWGSYTRLQGTLTLLCYLVVSFSMLRLTKRREQLHQLWTVLILTSVPVSLYALVQHFHLDPLLWGGVGAAGFPSRVSSTMGNPIFLGSYLMMVIPLTLARVADTARTTPAAGQKPASFVALTLTYVAISGLQVLCLLFTQSRGPFLGLLSGLYLFTFLALLALRPENGDRGLDRAGALKALVFTVLSIPLGVAPAYVLAVALKKGFRWLWLSWILHSLLAAAVLLLLVFSRAPLPSFGGYPLLGRLAQMRDTEAGSVKVRMLIWQGTIELLKSDRSRALLGYGPESIQTVFHRVYPPELIRHEHRYATVDRTHNETFDALLTTGLLGTGVYLLIMGGIFSLGCTWLGASGGRRDSWSLLAFMGAGGVAGITLPRWIEGTFRMSGLGLSLGFIAGGMLYLWLAAATRRFRPVGTDTWLFIGLFAALVAHLVETQFGIAVSVTRLYFWICAGMFVLVGTNRLGAPDGSRDPDRPLAAEGSPGGEFTEIAAGALAMAIGLFTMSTEFLQNQRPGNDWLGIVRDSFATLGQSHDYQPSCGVAGILLATWFLGGAVIVAEHRRHTRLQVRNGGGKSGSGMYAYITLLAVFIGAALRVLDLLSATDPASTVTFYTTGLGILVLFLGWSLCDNRPDSARRCRKSGSWLYPVIIVLAVILTVRVAINPIKADSYFKLGLLLKGRKQTDQAIDLVRRAVFFAPARDVYLAELGRLLMMRAETAVDADERELLLKESLRNLERARDINPLNWENDALLGHLFSVWGTADARPEGRGEKLQHSRDHYRRAARQAPQNFPIYNLWAQDLLAQGDLEGALQKARASLSLEPEHGPTYHVLSAVYSAQGRWAEAEEAYLRGESYQTAPLNPQLAKGYRAWREGNLEEAKEALIRSLRTDPDQPEARSVLGLIYFTSGRMDLALEENLQALALAPDDVRVHNNLALMYLNIGRPEEALRHARVMEELSPEPARPAIRTFIERLEAGGASPGQKRP